jgi:hypothetical protein
VLLCSVSLLADPSLPGGPFVDPNIRNPGNFWFSRNAVSLYHEQFFGEDHQLYLWAYPSLATKPAQIWAPRFAYRWRDKLWLDVGVQRNETDPFISELNFQGARIDYDLEPYRLSASLGETGQESLPRILQGQLEFSVDQLALTRRLGDYGWTQLSTSGWRPQNPNLAIQPSYRPPEQSRVVSLAARPDLSFVDDLQVGAGYGLELAGPIDSLPGDRRAYSWDLGWQRSRFRLDARQSSQGRGYGPGHIENFQRGQSSMNISGTLDVLPNLRWRESFDRFIFAQPLESGSRRSNENDTFSHELLYQPTPDLSATVLLSRSLNKLNPLNIQSETERAQLRVDWNLNEALRFGLTHSNNITSGQGVLATSLRTDLRADWWPNPRNRAGRPLAGGESFLGQRRTRPWSRL